MHHVLITGGAGFIGTHVARQAIAAGHTVRVLDSLSPQIHGARPEFEAVPGSEFVRGDVTSRADWQRVIAGVDTVIHLAAETGTGQSMYEIDRYYLANVQGTARLFDVLANDRHTVANVVLASSRSVYGEGAYICRNCVSEGIRRYPDARSAEQLARRQWTPPCPSCGGPIEPTATAEDDRLAPASIYAATKLAQEEMVRVACGALGLRYSILRLQNVFGEGQSLRNPYTGILSIFSTRIRLGFDLPIFEDGAETRDFVHVDDVVRAVLHAIEQAPSAATLNVGSGSPAAVLEVARLLSSIMNSNIEPHITGEYRIGDIRHNYADISRLKSAGVEPTVNLEVGLRRFCDWVATQPISPDLLDRANAELKARKLMA